MRYDGFRFTLFEARPGEKGALQHSFVHSLTPRTAGGLWLWTGWGGLQHLDVDTEHFDTLATGPHLIPGETFVYVIHESSDGILWFGTEDGLVQRSADGTVSLVDEIEIQDVEALSESPDGRLCAGGEANLWCRDEEEWKRVGLPRGSAFIGAIGWSISGSLIVATDTGVFEQSGDWRLLSGASRVTTLATSPSGDLWASSPSGLIHLRARGGSYEPMATVPMTSETIDLWADARNQLWGVMMQSGIFRLSTSTSAVQTRMKPENADARFVLRAAEHQGELWIGSTDDGLCTLSLHDLERTCRPIPLDLVQQTISDVAHTPDGRAWIAGYGDGMRCRSPGDPSFGSCANMPDRLEHPRKMLVDSRGRLWVASADDGLFVLLADASQDRWMHLPTSRSIAPEDSSFAFTVPLLEDARGRIWVGTLGGGVYRVVEREGVPVGLRRVPLGWYDGERPLSIVSLAQTEDGHVFAASRENGVARISQTDSVRWLGRSDGLPSRYVSALIADKRGALWAFSVGSAARYGADGRFRTFGAQDGFGSLAPSWHSASNGSDGQIYVGSRSGLVSFDPDDFADTHTLPETRFMSLRVRGVPRALPHSALKLGPRDGTLALDLSATEISQNRSWQFAWLLESETDEGYWTALGSQATLNLSGLQSGSYRLRVRTQTADRSGPERELSFAIAPFAWETGWFRGAAALLVLGLLYGAHRYRLFQIRRRLLLRQRIADDLHDDLGAKAGAIALRLDVERRLLSTPGGDGVDPQSERLHALAGEARQLVRDVRDVVWVVDAAEDHLPALAERIAEAAKSLIPANLLTVTIGLLPDAAVPMGTRRHLLLATKEALHNASKYATDAPVLLSVSCADGVLELVVSDKGPGFDPSTLTRGGRGMKTLRRRADEAGADLTVSSVPGAGTSVTLRWTLRRT